MIGAGGGAQNLAGDRNPWHCSLLLRAKEGELRDEKWQEIAPAFVDRLRFGEQDDALLVESTEDGAEGICRNPDYVPGRCWLTVRHGFSERGNDHIYIKVSLIREDATKGSEHPFRDSPFARRGGRPSAIVRTASAEGLRIVCLWEGTRCCLGDVVVLFSVRLPWRWGSRGSVRSRCLRRSLPAPRPRLSPTTRTQWVRWSGRIGSPRR